MLGILIKSPGVNGLLLPMLFNDAVSIAVFEQKVFLEVFGPKSEKMSVILHVTQQ
jgi:hypothetical protein